MAQSTVIDAPNENETTVIPQITTNEIDAMNTSTLTEESARISEELIEKNLYQINVEEHLISSSIPGSPALDGLIMRDHLAEACVAEILSMSNPDAQAVCASFDAKQKLCVRCKCDKTTFGDTVCIIGSSTSLGKWKTPISLGTTDYPVWESVQNIEKGECDIEYKYIIKKADGCWLWESGDNRRIKSTNEDLCIYDEPVF